MWKITRKVTIVSPGHRDDNPRAFCWRVMTGTISGLKFTPDHKDDFKVTFASEQQIEDAIAIADYLEFMQHKMRAALDKA